MGAERTIYYCWYGNQYHTKIKLYEFKLTDTPCSRFLMRGLTILKKKYPCFWGRGSSRNPAPDSALEVLAQSQPRISATRGLQFQYLSQWIGLRENLQETMVFTIKYRGFRFQFSHHPILWLSQWIGLREIYRKVSGSNFPSNSEKQNHQQLGILSPKKLWKFSRKLKIWPTTIELVFFARTRWLSHPESHHQFQAGSENPSKPFPCMANSHSQNVCDRLPVFRFVGLLKKSDLTSYPSIYLI